MNRLEFLCAYLHLVATGHAKCFNISTHLTLRERLFLYLRVSKLDPKPNIVEIGSYLGASSCFLSIAAGRLGGKVYCVDTWQNDGMTEGKRDTYDEFLKNTYPYEEVIVPIRTWSREAVTSFSATADLIFVDANHEYECVKDDLKCWLPILRPGGSVILHDSGWAEGVQRAIKEVVVPLQIGKPTVLPNMYAARMDSQKLAIKGDS